jgi:hypothetical protein
VPGRQTYHFKLRKFLEVEVGLLAAKVTGEHQIEVRLLAPLTMT